MADPDLTDALLSELDRVGKKQRKEQRKYVAYMRDVTRWGSSFLGKMRRVLAFVRVSMSFNVTYMVCQWPLIYPNCRTATYDFGMGPRMAWLVVQSVESQNSVYETDVGCREIYIERSDIKIG